MAFFPESLSDKNAERILSDIKNKKSAFWEQEKEKNALDLFHRVAEAIPAYKDFLKKGKISHLKIKTFEDFKNIPPVTKSNYLLRYPLEKLTWPKAFGKTNIFASTSGSTGHPFYFPRGAFLDWQASIGHELYMRQGARSDGPTLIVVCFGMGVWIGGLLTYKAFELMSLRNDYPVSIVTPGINKVEIFRALKQLSSKFSQIVLAGYPPFLKDVIDEAPLQGINLKEHSIRILNAAEPYTERFRDYIAQKIKVKNIYRDIANIYGTTDLGAMAQETPLSILVRKTAVEKQKIFTDLFSSIGKTPTFAQYVPYFIALEEIKGELLITGNNTIPLIRYAIGDRGGVMNFNEVCGIMKKNGIDVVGLARRKKISDVIYQLPFVYVYERSDFSTTFYGLQIYPEYIREALFKKSLQKFTTGKFTMETKFDKKHNQYLEIHIELKKNRKANNKMYHYALHHITDHLLSASSEFKELFSHLKTRALPKLAFWEHEHPLYFKAGTKQSWTKKNQ